MSSGPATTLAPEIMASLDLGVMPELLFNMGWKMYMNGLAVAANGALASKWQIRCPDHQTLVIVERIIITTTTAVPVLFNGSWGYGPGVADLATVSNLAFFRDGRTRPSGQTPIVFSTENSANFAAPFSFDMNILPNTPVDVPGAPFVLWKGNALLIQSGQVNTQMCVTCVWRERPPVSGEQMPLGVETP